MAVRLQEQKQRLQQEIAERMALQKAASESSLGCLPVFVPCDVFFLCCCCLVRFQRGRYRHFAL